MDSLKQNAFTIAVILMLVVLGVAAYFLVAQKAMEYNAKLSTVASRRNRLKKYTGKDTVVPTERLKEVKIKQKADIEAELEKGTKFFDDKKELFNQLKFAPDGAEIIETDIAAISAAFDTAINNLLARYSAVQKEYVKKVYQPELVNALDFNNLEMPEIKVAKPELTLNGGKVMAAKRCHMMRALINAAVDAGWGGLTYIEFDKFQGIKEQTAPVSSREKSGRRGEQKKEEEKILDPKTLYDGIALRVAGEMQYADLGPFLHQIHERSKDPSNPVLFVVEKIVMTKQKSNLLKPVYTATYSDSSEAESASLDKEVQNPAAAVRIELSALEWKGFPPEETPSAEDK